MNSNSWLDALETALTTVLAHLPAILGAFLLVLVGWLTAKLLSIVAKTLSARALQRLPLEKGLATALDASGTRAMAPKLIGSSVFWIVLLLFVVAAVEILGLPVLTDLLGKSAAYLPNIIAAAALVIAGLAGGRLVRGMARKGAVLMHLEPQSRALEGVAQTMVVTIAGVMALEQLGVQGRLLETVLALILGSVLAAGGLAFALGARTAVANIIAMRYVAQVCKVGQGIEIDGLRGTIVQVTSTAVVIESEKGRVMIPAARFHEGYPVLLKAS